MDRTSLEKTTQLEDRSSAVNGNQDPGLSLCVRSANPEEAYFNSELSMRVYELILSLPFEYRVPVILRDIEGLPVHEIASILGLKEPTTKTRIHRARLRLREKLTRYARRGLQA